jgi:hypothetical protein
MIVVTVELRSARTGKKTLLGVATITNDGEGTETQGDYVAVFSRRHDPASIWKVGMAHKFPRKRLLMWDLLYRCLREVCGDRNS